MLIFTLYGLTIESYYLHGDYLHGDTEEDMTSVTLGDLWCLVYARAKLDFDLCEEGGGGFSIPNQTPRIIFKKHMGGGPRVVVSTAAFHARVRGSVPGLGGLKEAKMFLPHPRVKVSIVGSLRDREVACSASDRQGSNFESCVWRTVSSQSSHHPQEVLLAQFSLNVHKGGLKPDSFHFISFDNILMVSASGRYATAFACSII